MDFITENWNNASYSGFLQHLFNNQDIEYKKFHSSIVPGIGQLIGIRMPILRGIAKDIAKGDWRGFLLCCRDLYYEEVMIQGLVIGLVKVEYPEFLKLVTDFTDKINNWGICDSFCSGLKSAGKYQDDFFPHLKFFLNSKNPWHIRTGLVIMIFHYMDEGHIGQILSRCDSIRCEHYYVKMANAWLISICYINFPSITLEYLAAGNKLDKWTHNKAIQKIRESRRVSPGTKAFLKTLKREN